MIPLNDSLSISFWVWPKLLISSFGNFFDCAFHLVFVVATTNLSFFIAVTLRGLEFDMLMYSDHLQNWLDFEHDLLIFLIWDNGLEPDGTKSLLELLLSYHHWIGQVSMAP